MALDLSYVEGGQKERKKCANNRWDEKKQTASSPRWLEGDSCCVDAAMQEVTRTTQAQAAQCYVFVHCCALAWEIPRGAFSTGRAVRRASCKATRPKALKCKHSCMCATNWLGSYLVYMYAYLVLHGAFVVEVLGPLSVIMLLDRWRHFIHFFFSQKNDKRRTRQL